MIKTLESLPEDKEKARNLHRLHELTMFTDPELARTYAITAFEISKNIQDIRGIAAGYLQIGNYFTNRNEDDSASYYYQKALMKFKEVSSIRGQIFAYHSLADIERSRGNYDQAISLIHHTIALYENRNREKNDLGDFNLIGAEYLVLGAIYLDQGSYRLALQETLNALRFFEENKDKVREADALKQLGDIEYALGNYDSSLAYCKKALQIYIDFDDKVYQAYAAGAAGLAVAELGNDSLAISYQKIAINTARDVDSKSPLSAALKELGRIYTRKKNYEQAKSLLNEALQITQETNIKLDMAAVLIELATLELQTHRYDRALNILHEVIHMIEPIGALPFLRSAYKMRSSIYATLHQLPAALEDYKKFHSLNDSIYNSTKSRQIEELKTIYETEKKETALTLQAKKIENLNQEVKISNLKKGLYAGGMFAFIAISILFWLGFRQKIRKSQVEQEARETIYRQELAFKQKELTSQTLHLVQKNMFLENLRENLEIVQNSPDAFQVQSNRVLASLKTEVALDEDWKVFKSYFVEVHNDFDQKLIRIYPDITENEMRLAFFLRMNLNTREIAAMLHVLPESVRKSRYRLKKKLHLGKDDDLYNFLAGL